MSTEKPRSTPAGGSGRSDTGRGHVCPCGRSHPSPRRRSKLRPPTDLQELSRRVYDAFANGKSETDNKGRHIVHYAGNCLDPIELPQHSSSGALFVIWRVRCRRCPPCRRAKQFYWARAAMRMTKETEQAGLRTWFGTLTLSPLEQQSALDEAISTWAEGASGSSIPEWWDDIHCDRRFALIRNVLVDRCKRYWKRLRKGVKRCETCFPKKPRAEGEWDHPPAAFKYFLVFERHRSGHPHMHFLMHETRDPIRLKQMKCAWPHGHTDMKLVKGADLTKAAYYVSKYLGKSQQSRQIASLRYARINTASASSGNEVETCNKHKLRPPEWGRPKDEPNEVSAA